ncbi:hypothetical protein [Paenibacillus roseipurpureus]|uniref:Uncharacterized protein n=1 Tax=Paenibacillus roseopurpureus TaxID=2918901 RepID=A0AA96LPV8_9BACL|nr:hypothetical protein [Paenibacillus sp. MBLB1832]WNR42715.1 hypothetical protein MJB10_16495 [Paenibacillus sp. MBLB1832]
MKELINRKDRPAIRDTLIWFAALGITGTLALIKQGEDPAYTVIKPLPHSARLYYYGLAGGASDSADSAATQQEGANLHEQLESD